MTAEARPRVLMVGHGSADAGRMQLALGPEFECVQRASLSETADLLDSEVWAAVMMDLGLAESDGFGALTSVLERARGAPVIVVARDVDETRALRAIEIGAHDYLLRDRCPPEALRRSLTYAIERVRIQRALRTIDRHFRLFAENSSDVLAVSDLDGVITFVSPSVETMFGTPPDEILGTHGLDFVVPDDLEHMAAAMEAVVTDPGSRTTLDCRARSPHGEVMSLEVTMTALVEEEAVTGVIANVKDVTATREVEQALVESERRHRLIVESANDGIATIDNELQATFVNPKLAEIFGRPAGEILGRPFVEFAPRELQEEVRRALLDVFDRIPLTSRQWRFVRPNGTALWVNVRASALAGPGGDATGLLVVVSDESERHRAAQEASARRAAVAASEAKSEFMSRMSHELRTPLNAILGFAQLLDRDGLTENQFRQTGAIIKAGRHLLNLINEVLEVSRFDSGNAESLSIEPVLLAHVLDEAIELVRPMAEQSEVRLLADMSGARDGFVQADRQRLKQILINLLSNAVKYNRPDGSVTVTAQRERGRLRVDVTDTGIGIAPADAQRLFVPFERLGAGSRGIEGTGLGLALSRRLAQAMGADIRVHSVEGQGSTFSIDLVEAEPPVKIAFTAPAGGLPGAGPSGATILYIEDNLSNFQLLEEVLATWPDVRLLPAMQGRIGLELARRHQPDLILLDLDLPDMSGRALLERLRGDPQTADVAVIVITADASSGLHDHMIDAGANAFLTKPLDIEAFMNALEQTLGAA